jgi:hypothetical protein
MRHLFGVVIEDETGSTRLGWQLEELWQTFLREIDDEMRPLANAHAAAMRA